MADKLILPQNTRLMGVFLGFVGGSLDVFCHIQYHSLVATQTGNILLLISDWRYSNVINTMLRFCSPYLSGPLSCLSFHDFLY